MPEDFITVLCLQVCSVALSECGTYLDSCGRDGFLSVLSMATMEQVVFLQTPKKVETCDLFTDNTDCFMQLLSFPIVVL